MLRLLYRLFAGGVGLLCAPYGRLRARRGDERWRGRLGLIDPIRQVDVWLHASSVGEVRVLSNLIRFLHAQRPDLRLHLTAMTPAGLATARTILEGFVSTSYFPLDTPAAMRRTLDSLRPLVIVIAETEIWPNLIDEAARRHLPLVLVNGRMSPRALGRYRMISGSIGPLLETYDHFFFKTAGDAERFATFCIDPSRAIVAGDMKFDAPLPLDRGEQSRAARAELEVGDSDFLLVAGSTRESEEETLLGVYRELKKNYPQLKMILAPRHIERCRAVVRLIRREELDFVVYGRGAADLTVVDRLGLLNRLYMAADLAFVGGTLVDIGGHNLLEPVWAGTPVVFGPSLGNVAEAAAYIEEHGYGMKVSDKVQLSDVIGQTIDGRLRFQIKTEDDNENSASALAGRYILSRLADA